MTVKQYLKEFRNNYNSARVAKTLSNLLPPCLDGYYTFEALDSAFNNHYDLLTFRPTADDTRYLP